MVYAISLQAFNGNDDSVLLQLSATVYAKQVSVLVDFGSSTSFINAKLITEQSQVRDLARIAKVKIANGDELQCTSELFQCPWTVQNQEFCTTFKILPLGGFDIILGMDWLEQHNPYINWVTKKIAIRVNGVPVALQGQQVTL